MEMEDCLKMLASRGSICFVIIIYPENIQHTAVPHRLGILGEFPMWLTAAVTVSVPITHPGQGCWQCCFKFRTVVRPSIWDKSSDIKIRQWGRPWLVWYVLCKRRCVPGSLNSNTDIVIAMIVTGAVKLTQSGLGDSHYFFHCIRRTITRIGDKITLKCVTAIHCIDPADLFINISD